MIPGCPIDVHVVSPRKKIGYSAVEKNPHKLDSMDTPHFYI